MPTKISALARRPLWIITSYRNNRMEVLTIDPEGNGGSLPVFSFEEEAKTFLGLSDLVQRSPRALCRGAVGEPQGDSRRASTCLGADCLYSPTFREDLLSETRPPVCGVLGTLAYRTE